MAIIITLESALCFGYCVAFLRGLYGKKNLWWAELLRWYPSLLLFPVIFYYLTEAIFRLPGCRLFSDSLVTCRDSGYRHPIIKPADEVSCTRRRSPVGSSFPCQLIHLYPRTTGPLSMGKRLLLPPKRRCLTESRLSCPSVCSVVPVDSDWILGTSCF